MIKKIGNWGGSKSLRLEIELKALGLVEGDEVKTTIIDDKLIITKKKCNDK